MEVNLNPDLQAKLDRLADDRGCDTGTLVQVSAQNENVLFCKVEMSYPFIAADLPFPSRCIVLHRVQPSRLPFGAVKAALTAPGRDAGKFL